MHALTIPQNGPIPDEYPFPSYVSAAGLEAAARHFSYSRAAEELHVTQSAISHQIRHLEQLWNVRLFERQGRRVVLTAAGQALVPVVRDFIERLGAILQELQERINRVFTGQSVAVVCVPNGWCPVLAASISVIPTSRFGCPLPRNCGLSQWSG